MMTPFVGLSTLIHLILIIVYRLFHLGKRSHLLVYKYRSIKAVLGFAIIFSMFSFIFVSAAFMLSASVIEKHSSIHIIERYIDSHDSKIALGQL